MYALRMAPSNRKKLVVKATVVIGRGRVWYCHDQTLPGRLECDWRGMTLKKRKNVKENVRFNNALTSWDKERKNI